MRTVGIVLLVLCAPIEASAADDNGDMRIGQYFCYVENSAGIVAKKNGPTFAGKINLPDADKRFFLRITRIDHNEIVKELCAKTALVFKEAIANGSELTTHSTDTYGTSNFGEVCLRKFKAEIPNDPNMPWSLYGDDPYAFRGLLDHHSFSLYRTNEFTMVFPYDDGPVVETGKCEKIQPPKGH